MVQGIVFRKTKMTSDIPSHDDIAREKRLESMRQDFIANVSHELRTPLTVFRGYIELLKKHTQLPGDRIDDIVKHMDGQSQRMERLVEDLLLLSRLESIEPDKEQHQRVHVASLLRDICHDAQSLSGKQQHEFIVNLDEDLWLQGCLEELRSAFSNIIYNAVHYTPEKGTITISCFVDQQGSHIAVKDTGVGIAEKHIPRITQRFYRVDKSRASRGIASTGLGLAIVKHVLLRHDGQLIIESDVEKGSSFECFFRNLNYHREKILKNNPSIN